MPTDAPDGNVNAHVVRGRRPDHVTPKVARVRPLHEKTADVTETKAPVKKAPAKKATAKKATKKG